MDGEVQGAPHCRIMFLTNHDSMIIQHLLPSDNKWLLKAKESNSNMVKKRNYFNETCNEDIDVCK